MTIPLAQRGSGPRNWGAPNQFVLDERLGSLLKYLILPPKSGHQGLVKNLPFIFAL